MGDHLAFALWMIGAAMALSAILAVAALAPDPVPALDAGTDGPRGGIYLVAPMRYAGELQAVDLEHARGFVVGRPLRK